MHLPEAPGKKGRGYRSRPGSLTSAFDDDGAGSAFGTDSVLFYRALQTERYYVIVSAAPAGGVGGYLLGVEAIDAHELWDDNDDGKITCDETRAHNIAPVSFTHPAYEYMDDGDNNGWSANN